MAGTIILFLSFLLLVYFIYISEAERKKFLIKIGSIFADGYFFLLLLSLLSYRKGSVAENIGGVIGYKSSSTIISSIGIVASYFLIISFIVLISLLLFHRLNKSLSLKFFSLFIALFFVSAFLPIPLSGHIGISIKALLMRWTGLAGYILVPSIFAIASLFAGFKDIIKFGHKKGNMDRKSKKAMPQPAWDVNADMPQAESKTADVSLKEKTAKNKAPDTSRGKSLESPPPPGFNISHESLLGLLNSTPLLESEIDREELEKNATLIEEKLAEFNVSGKVVDYYPGPVVTRYDFEPAPGIKLSRITGLADDLALRMKSDKIRIVAPLPNKGLIGIEVPNKKRRIVYFSELASTDEFQKLPSKLSFALGVDTAGYGFYADLARMPHLLIAGSTGSGKSVSINTIITSILFRASPLEVRFLMIDPKRIELSFYEGIPHMLLPVVKDRKFAGEVLNRAVEWMDIRYKHFAKDGVKDIESHNKKARRKKEPLLPYIVIIIDEFADLILTLGKQIEEPLARLAQMARAVGIHLVVATQRPSVDVITGMIKANFPVRIAFKVASRIDSRTIIDGMGAEKLLGKGDMLFIPPGSSEPVRLHGPFISEEETRKIAEEFTASFLSSKLADVLNMDSKDIAREIVERNLHLPFIRVDEPGLEERAVKAAELLANEAGITYDEAKGIVTTIRENYYNPIEEMEEAPVQNIEENSSDIDASEWDSQIEDAAKLTVMEGKASATLLQRKMKVGFARAARIIDQMEKAGIIGPSEGSKPRKVLVETLDELDNILKRLKR